MPAGERPVDRVEGIVSVLDSIDLSLLPDAEAARLRARELAVEYLMPRALDRTGTVVAFVGGSGVGKSTIVNALAGSMVSEAGPRRPTTRELVVWSAGDPPATVDGLRRRAPGTFARTPPDPPDGSVIIDTPPPRVTGPGGGSLAFEVMRVADACVLVTSASRYADASTEGLLRSAAIRGLPLVIVMTRVDPTEAALLNHARNTFDRVAGIRSGGIEIITVPASVDTATGAGVERLRQVIVDWVGSAVPLAIEGSRAAMARHLDTVRRAVLDIEVLRTELEAVVARSYEAATDAFLDTVAASRFASEGDRADVAALAAAVVGHAAEAARRVEDRWGTFAPGLVARHHQIGEVGSDTIEIARALLEEWAGGEGRRRARRRSSLGPRLVTDESARPLRRDRRWARRSGVEAAARVALRRTVSTIMEHDARRFREVLGTRAPVGTLSALVLEDGDGD